MLRSTLALGAMMLALSPVMAQDKPAECASPIDKIVAQVIEGGGEFVDLIDVPGKDVDQMMVLRMGNAVVIGMVKDNCVVSPPIPLMEARFSKTSLGV
jgi:hypothetical protein